MRVLYHLQGRWNLVDVRRDADDVYHALRLGQDIVAVVGSLGVGHHRDLQVGRVVANDPTDTVLVAELPVAVIAGREDLSVGLIADLHRVNPGLDAGIVDSLHEPVLEAVVVDQPTVPDRAVQYLDLRPVCQPRALCQLILDVLHSRHSHPPSDVTDLSHIRTTRLFCQYRSADEMNSGIVSRPLIMPPNWRNVRNRRVLRDNRTRLTSHNGAYRARTRLGTNGPRQHTHSIQWKAESPSKVCM